MTFRGEVNGWVVLTLRMGWSGGLRTGAGALWCDSHSSDL